MPENDEWINKVREYCAKYNIPLNYLVDTINEPKVIPMVRGKAFEFSAMLQLQNVLSSDTWFIDKLVINAQFGMHDMDVRVIHKPSRKIIGVECKLAAKGSFRTGENNTNSIKVKCMRSRTLGDARVASLAPQLGVAPEQLKIHNDQYFPSDFDVVLTSIGNAFYETEQETELFKWEPSPEGIQFLKSLSGLDDETLLKDWTYDTTFLALSENISIKVGNNVTCTRRKCTNKNNCGFIPNYPLIKFNDNNHTNWTSIVNVTDLFLGLVERDLPIYEGDF